MGDWEAGAEKFGDDIYSSLEISKTTESQYPTKMQVSSHYSPLTPFVTPLPRSRSPTLAGLAPNPSHSAGVRTCQPIDGFNMLLYNVTGGYPLIIS